MKFEFYSDRTVSSVLERARETRAQLWVFFPESKTGEYFPIIIPREQTAGEEFWEAPLMDLLDMRISQEKRIADLERIENKFTELCQIAGGEAKLLGLLMATKLLTTDDTNSNQSDSGSCLRSAFLKGKGL
ncbi:hypothetical protein [Rheinheimera texasensis]|uniref:hypothetical protein n=1 Tax=Rheinheimera texasensis TaxID=306205 RepID=UPI0004E20C6D|nr:hypothetical protein [Rheinheimera texasensis]